MNDIAQLIEDMVRAGVAPELIGRTAAALAAREPIAVKDEQAERRRERDRERKRLRNSAESAPPLPNKEIPPTPPKEINPSPAAPIGAAPRGRAAFDEIEAKLFEAAGLSDFRSEKSPGLISLAPILDLIGRGYELEIDILPVVRDKCRTGFRPKTWGYFTEMVVERTAKRRAIPFKPPSVTVDWTARMDAFLANGAWAPSWGPRPGERGCKAPSEFQQRIAA